MEAKKIIITGGANRIGAAIAKKLSGPGVEIIIHYNKSKTDAEKLKNEFTGVKRSFIPVQAVVRSDEGEQEGAGKITEASAGNISNFPFQSMASVKPAKE